MKLLTLDCETTGTDPYRDRIVEVCLQLVDEALQPIDGQGMVARVNPGVPIPEEATVVHGISDADVADAPRFAEVAQFVQGMVQDAVLVTFNGRRFDVPLLHVELRRAGYRGMEKDEDGLLCPREIDLYQVWVRTEKRSLADAVRRFAGKELEEGHSASADTGALAGVLEGMVRDFGLTLDVDALCKVSVPEDSVDRDGKFRRDGDVIVFNFGTHRDKPATAHLDYLEWMLGADRSFPPETKIIARKILAAAKEKVAP